MASSRGTSLDSHSHSGRAARRSAARPHRRRPARRRRPPQPAGCRSRHGGGSARRRFSQRLLLPGTRLRGIFALAALLLATTVALAGAPPAPLPVSAALVAGIAGAAPGAARSAAATTPGAAGGAAISARPPISTSPSISATAPISTTAPISATTPTAALTPVAMAARSVLAAEPLEERYFHRGWRRNDGLPGNSVYAIARTSDGYLWLGTENGLARFDGKYFSAFTGADAAAFRSRFVGSLLTTRDGTLWIGTERGLLALRDGRVRRAAAAGSVLGEASISALAEDPGGDLWVGTRQGLMRRSVRSGEVTQHELANFRIKLLLAGGPDELWIGTESNGAWHLKGGLLTPAGPGPDHIADGSDPADIPDGGDQSQAQDAITGLVQGAGGRVLVFSQSALQRPTAHGHLALAALATGQAAGNAAEAGSAAVPAAAALAATAGKGTAATATAGASATAGGTAGMPLAAAARGDGAAVLDDVTAAEGRVVKGADTLWLNSAHNGVVRLADGKRWQASASNELAKMMVNVIYTSPDGVVWLGAGGDGLHQLIAKSCSTYTQRAGLVSERIEALLIEGDTVWAGTGEGLSRVRRRPDGSLAGDRAGAAATELSGTEVTTLWRDRAGTLWAGTMNGLLRRSRDGRWEGLPRWGERGTLEIEALYEDAAGRLWVATGGGLGRVAADGRSILAEPRLAGQEVTSLAEAGDGSLWIGTRGSGLQRLSPAAPAGGPRPVSGGRGAARGGAANSGSDNDAVVTLQPAAQLPLITGVWRGRGSEMWVATFGQGLLHYAGGRWTFLDEERGLADNTPRQLVLDPRGDLWVCTAAGISRVTRSSIDDLEAGRAPTLTSLSYGPQDGIAEGVCYGGNHPGATEERDGHIWFATTHGLVELRPEAMSQRSAGAADLRLDTFKVDGQDLSAEARQAPLSLPPGARHVDLEYSAPVFLARDRTALRYRLAGFESEWIRGLHFASYTSLPPGAYRFEAELRDTAGHWSEPATLATLDVQPPFYLSDVFGLLCGLVLTAGISLALHLTKRRLERRAAALEGLVDERTEALSEANRQLAAMARSDALTGLANRRHWQELLERETRRATRGEADLSLLLLDVDCFKAYNDTLGHPAGDHCLSQVAAAVRGAATRAGDLAARYGGEEFAVLLPATTPLQALSIAESLRQAVEQLGLPHPGSTVAAGVTVSVGVASLAAAALAAASLEGEAEGAERLLAEADEALYVAKRSGRNQVRLSPAAARAVMAAGARPSGGAADRFISSAA